MLKGVHKIKIGGGQDANQAIMRKMLCSLFEHGKIELTIKRAKLVKEAADRLICKAKKGDVAAKRFVFKKLNNKTITEKVMTSVVAALSDRNSGYLKMKRMGLRFGDAAEMAKLEFVNPIVELEAKSVETNEKNKKGSKSVKNKKVSPAALLEEKSNEESK